MGAPRSSCVSEAGAPEVEIEITPAMADAGRAAYYAIPRYPGDEPMRDEWAEIIFRAMWRARQPR